MSRIVRFAATGGPEVLRIEDEATPEAGPGEVRILVKAIGVNRAEAMRRRGIHNEPVTRFPAGLGNEAAGIIESVGKDVTVLRPAMQSASSRRSPQTNTVCMASWSSPPSMQLSSIRRPFPTSKRPQSG